jgi:hypothetical protein
MDLKGLRDRFKIEKCNTSLHERNSPSAKIQFSALVGKWLVEVAYRRKR